MAGIGGQPGSPPSALSTQPSLAELYANSRAAEFGLSAEQFVEILEEVAAKNFPAGTQVQKQEFYRRLHTEDLVLTRMCAAGNDHAWEVFMLRFREKLYDASRQITLEDSSDSELADSLYADLFGTKTRHGDLVTKLISY